MINNVSRSRRSSGEDDVVGGISSAALTTSPDSKGDGFRQAQTRKACWNRGTRTSEDDNWRMCDEAVPGVPPIYPAVQELRPTLVRVPAVGRVVAHRRTLPMVNDSSLSGLWPREESNLRTQIRSLPLYPLSYGASGG